jgi:hypothetical protein
MFLTPSVEQLSSLWAPRRHAFTGGSFFAEHLSVPIKQGKAGRCSYEDSFFLWTEAGDTAGVAAATKLTENAITPMASNCDAFMWIASPSCSDRSTIYRGYEGIFVLPDKLEIRDAQARLKISKM